MTGPQVVLELELEGFAAAMDERFGGGKGAAQHLGDLFVGEFLLAAEQQGDALILGQVAQRLLDLGRQFLLETGLVGFGALGVVGLHRSALDTQPRLRADAR